MLLLAFNICWSLNFSDKTLNASQKLVSLQVLHTFLKISKLALNIETLEDVFCDWQTIMGWWCSGTYSGLPCRRTGVRFPYPPILEKWAKGICLCNLLRSTQPNDRETVIEG